MVDATIKGHNGRTVPHPLRIKGPVNGWMIKDQDSPLGQTLWHHGEVEEGKIGCPHSKELQPSSDIYCGIFLNI